MNTQLKERPLVLTTEEVNAVLAGHKTQHRMSIEKSDNTAILFDGRDWRYDGKEFIEDACCDPNPRGKHYFEQIKHIGNRTEFLEDYRSIGHCPLGKVGDRLWVQEDFIPDPPAGHDAWEDEDSVTNYFQWDGCGSKLSEIPNRLRTSEHVIYKAGQDDPDSMMWFNALQMRKWASRLLLEITDIRIERILDISDTDAKAMGLKPDYCDHKYQTCEDIGCIGKWAGALFLHLRHEKKLAVHYTDWVWVIEFKKVDD